MCTVPLTFNYGVRTRGGTGRCTQEGVHRRVYTAGTPPTCVVSSPDTPIGHGAGPDTPIGHGASPDTHTESDVQDQKLRDVQDQKLRDVQDQKLRDVQDQKLRTRN